MAEIKTKTRIEIMLEKIGIEAITEHVPVVLKFKNWFDASVPKQEDSLEFIGNDGGDGLTNAYIKTTRDKFFLHPQKAVCKKWAGMLFNEQTDFKIFNIDADDKKTGAAEIAYLNEIYTKKKLWQRLEAAMIKVFGIGTKAFVVEYSREYGIVLCQYDADAIFPITIENGEITEVSFLSQIVKSGATYSVLNVHTKRTDLEVKADGQSRPAGTVKTIGYKIRNFVFDKNNEPVSIEALGYVSEAAEYDMPCRTFSIVKPFNREIEDFDFIQNTLGIPTYFDALDIVKEIDSNFDAKYLDTLASRKVIFVREDFLPKSKSGYLVPEFVKNMLVVGKAASDLSGQQEAMKEFAPQPRMKDYSEEIQNGLNRLSHACGLGSEEFKVQRGAVATATQIISENQEKFVNLKKHNSIMQGEFIALNRAILATANEKEGKTFNLDLDIGFFIQDSVVVDDETRKQRAREEVQAGLMSAEYYIENERGLQGDALTKELDLLKKQKEQDTTDFLRDTFGAARALQEQPPSNEPKEDAADDGGANE